MWIVRQQDTRRSRKGNTMASRRRVVSTMPKKYFPKVCGCLTFIYMNFKLSAHFNKFIYRIHLYQCTWAEARSQRHLQSLCFSGRSEKQDGRPGLWLAETFSTSPLKQLNGIQLNLTGSKIITSSTKFVFIGPIGKTRWLPWPLIGWDIFDFSSETAERNSTKLDTKQDLNVIYKVCVFRADEKNKMAALASDWLWHFDFSSETAEWNSTTLDRKQGLNVLYQVCFFFGSIGKTRWPPWPLMGWGIFNFSSETVELNSMKLDRKRDLNILYQVCIFRANRENKMAALADSSKRLHIVLRCTICGPLGLSFILVIPPKGRRHDKRTRKNVVELEVQSPSRGVRKSPRTTPSKSSTCFGEPKSQPSPSSKIRTKCSSMIIMLGDKTSWL